MIKRFLALTGLLLLLASCNLPKTTPPTPTATPGPSATPTMTLTPAPSATPLPTPTPLPAARVLTGDRALFNGQYDQARQEYNAVLGASQDAELRATALLGLCKTDLADGNTARALDNLRQLVRDYPNATHIARAYFLLGETYSSLQRYQEAAEAYARYLELRPGLLDAYVQEKRGDALAANGSFAEAITAYGLALQAGGQADPNQLAIKIASTHATAGDIAGALQLLEQVDNATSDDYTHAQVDLLAGRYQLQAGNPAEAYKRWQHAVANYPMSINSYYALVGLVDAGQTVGDFDRGLVDYFAGQYDVALAAFDRYIESTPTHDGTALHYRALILREIGKNEEAIAEWEKVILTYKENRYWAAAWTEKAFTQWYYLDQYDFAAQTLQDYLLVSPTSNDTLDISMSIGRIYERGGNLEKAANQWEGIAAQFPSDPGSVDALFLAGVTRYRMKDYQTALDDFQRNLILASENTDKARAFLWIGKSYQALGDETNSHNAWQQGQALDTVDYYSIRARDLLLGRPAFEPAASYKLEINLPAERKSAAAWLRVNFNLPAETDLLNLGALESNIRYQRGLEFWEMDYFPEARAEFETLREAIKDNPADSFRLGNALIDLGAYRIGIFAIRQVLTLAGLDDHSASLSTNPYFSHIRYGLYYPEIINPIAQEQDFDPIFITSLIRQESLFESFAGSSAGARGLMQIIPSTGASIAEQMGWPPDYTDADRYNPYISVRMGTFYLNSIRRLFKGDLYASLAAYNGGPGNATVWKELAGDDPDLFLEIIRYPETRAYIRGIYEIYTIYRNIYAPEQ